MLVSARLPKCPALMEQSKAYLNGGCLDVRLSLPEEEVVYLVHYAECLN